MKTLVLAAALSLVATSAFATCKGDAADKKLAGAALKSFMTKCESDAKKSCEADTASKKLAGAAKTSPKVRHRRRRKLSRDPGHRLCRFTRRCAS
jgi:hypothetical protein